MEDTQSGFRFCFLCTAVSKFSAFLSFRRWGVLVRIIWDGLPVGRAQMDSIGKPEERFFGRNNVSPLCI